MPSSAFVELQQLDSIRLDHNWTFVQLSADMAARGVNMRPRTLHYLLKGSPPTAHPLDRTLYQIRKYVDDVRASRRQYMKQAKRRSRRKARTQGAANGRP